MRLEDLHRLAAERWGEAPAVVAGDGRYTYLDLDRAANRLARRLAALGVSEGDRVGVWLPKGGRAVIAFQAVLRRGAAYVPLDPTHPPERVAGILTAAGIRCVVATEALWSSLPDPTREDRAVFLVDGSEGWSSLEHEDPRPLPRVAADDQSLAYILYTSGSTGTPKGVCLSHGNALAFIHWARRRVEAERQDRFSSHAPFHFDLSVFDIYVPALAGASLHVLSEGASYAPKRLVRHLVEREITVWYSVPSALVLMLEHGDLTAKGAPRVLVFAGEPFPIDPLRRLRALWPESRFFNFYGPTETNVCAAYEVERVAPEATSVPIGGPASGNELWAETSSGLRAETGEDGELVVQGPTVMMGYWGDSAKTSNIYRTGDMVRVLENGEYTYIGRRDGMIKRRGYRIELGEIESVLSKHPDVGQSAATALGSGLKTQIVAFLVGNSPVRPSNLQLRSYLSQGLPGYMFPDRMLWVEALPLTRNGKVDRGALAKWAGAEERETDYDSN